MAGKTQSQKKKALDMRSKMYLVLALCSVMLLVSVGISLVLIGGIGLGGADAQSVSTVDSASMVVESGYNKEENTIDTQAYTRSLSRPPTRATAMWTRRCFWATATRPACTACSTIAATTTPSARWA